MRRTPNLCIGGRMHRIKGEGMGSVLLNKGGAGGGSSYENIDAYENAMVGGGLGDLSKKLANIIVKPLQKKPKNIAFKI